VAHGVASRDFRSICHLYAGLLEICSVENTYAKGILFGNLVGHVCPVDFVCVWILALRA
jgi:hypothetical protein